MNNKLKPIYIIASVIIAIIICTLLFCIGLFIGPKDQPIYTYFFFLYIAIVIVYIIICVRLTRKYSNKINNIKAQGYLDIIMEKKEWVKNNQELVRPMIYKLYKNVKFQYNIVMLVLILGLIYSGICFKAIVNIEDLAPMAAVVAPFSIFCCFILIYLHINIKTHLFVSNHVKENDYPILSSFIGDILNKEDITKKFTVTILICSADCSVNETNKSINFAIGDLLLKYLTLDELKSVIYHEIAHFRNQDTKYLKKIYKYKFFFNKLMEYGLTFLCPNLVNVSFEVNLLDECSNINYEIACDNYVLEKGVNKEYALACVKGFGMSLFADKICLDINTEVFKNHKWTSDAIAKYYSYIKASYNKNINFIDYCSKNHLEERVPTHPNVKERRNKFYNGDLDIHLIENDYFDNDIKNAFLCVSKYFNVKQDEMYLMYIDEYQKKIENINKLEIEELPQLLDNAMNLNDIENAIKIANIIIEKEENDLFANLSLGIINSEYLFCDDCIKYYNVVLNNSNTNYKLQALNLLGIYYVRTGNEQKRDELREIQVGIVDNSRSYELAQQLFTNDVLLQYDNEKINTQIIEIVKAMEWVEKVICGQKVVDDSVCIHYALICKNKTNYDDIKEDLNKINNYLFSQINNYELHIFNEANLNVFKKLKNKELQIFKKAK